MRPILNDIDKKTSITITVNTDILKNITDNNKSQLINNLLKNFLINNGYSIKNNYSLVMSFCHLAKTPEGSVRPLCCEMTNSPESIFPPYWLLISNKLFLSVTGE